MKKLILIVMVAVLAGCASFENFISDSIDTAYIIKANEGVSETVLKADLTTIERQVVYDAEQSMLDLGAYLEAISSPSDVIMLDGVIEVAAEKYRHAKTVSLSHIGEYSQNDWDGLVALDSQLTAMYERYKEFKADQKYSEAASQLGEYAKLGLKLAVILGG